MRLNNSMGNPIIEEQARVAGSYADKNSHAREILERIEERQTVNELYHQEEQKYK